MMEDIAAQPTYTLLSRIQSSLSYMSHPNNHTPPPPQMTTMKDSAGHKTTS